ncbi:MAG: ribonuclease III [Kiritimatiellae bacterium]|nr:ribonuclease III [Kiritimatiellia bacterium]
MSQKAESLVAPSTASEALMERIGYRFRDGSLLATALTHPTYSNNVERVENNQRMEFLGDAVLGLLTAEHVYRSLPEGDEGLLTVVRSKTVSGEALASLGAEIGLGPLLRTDEGGADATLRSAPHTLACATEALFGAVWLDGGIEAAKTVFGKLVVPRIGAVLGGDAGEGDPKGRLQAYAHRNPSMGLPVYEVLSREGPDNCPVFRARVTLGGRSAEGSAGRRRLAEAAAAEAWLASEGDSEYQPR